jgi:hypothetical protein
MTLGLMGFAQFNLQSPPDNTSLTVEGKASTSVNISWTSQNSLTGNVLYTWHLDLTTGNFTNPLVSIASNNQGTDTTLTLSYGAIDGVLKSAGVNLGASAPLKWTVTATNGTSVIVSPDTFNITLTRGSVIDNFDLVFPSNAFAATIEGNENTALDIKWNSSGEGATYAWFLDLASGNFSKPIVGPLASNNSGKDTVLTLDFNTINSVLVGAGVQVGQTANLKWKVHTYAGNDSIASTSEHTLNLTRGNLLKTFELDFPGDGFSTTIEGKGSTSLDIKWMNAGDSAKYDWYLDLTTGDFTNPLVGPLASNNGGMDTALTLDYSTINNVLAGAGVTIGNTANLKWTVKAKTGKATLMADTSFAINLTRGAVITNFMLDFPADGFAATIPNDNSQSITIKWNSAGEGATYKWFLDVSSGNYANALVNGLASNNSGMDTALTLDFATIYSVLVNAGVTPGATANLKWKVHAYAGNDSISSGDRNINLTRDAASSLVSNQNKVNKLTVWPNPVRIGSAINISELESQSEIRLIDVTGKEVIRVKSNDGGNAVVETQNIKSGVYFIQVTSPQGMISRKLVVE